MAEAKAFQPLTLTVTQKAQVADDIVMFELQHPSEEDLPPFSAGAHITVTTPSGQKRRYSLCNNSVERNHYVIAVKREKSGRGGSLSFTTGVEVGANIEAEAPENEFQMSQAVSPRNVRGPASGERIKPLRLRRLELHVDVLFLRVGKHLLEAFLPADARLFVAAER